MINVQTLTSTLAKLPDQALQQYAQMHKNDPYVVALAVSESNRRKEMRTAAQAQGVPPGQPPVVDEAISGMQAQLPEAQGIGLLPAPNMEFADGGVVGYSGGGSSISFDEALDREGVRDPRQRAFLKSIYQQESSSGKITKTSPAGAVGSMQIMPKTFAGVADKGWSIQNPEHSMRAGIRYGLEALAAAKGDPVLAGVYYYGGPGGLKAAERGEARMVPAAYDPKGTAPNTLQYGQQVGARTEQMAATVPPAEAPPVDTQGSPDQARLAALDAKIAELKPKLNTSPRAVQAMASLMHERTQLAARIGAGGSPALTTPTPAVAPGTDDNGELARKLAMHPAPAGGPAPAGLAAAAQAGPPTPAAGAGPAQSAHDVLGSDLLAGLQKPFREELDAVRGRHRTQQDELRALFESLRPKGTAYADAEQRLNTGDAKHADAQKENTKLAVIRAGLGMLASGDQYGLRAIGKGATQGLESYMAGLADLRKAQSDRDNTRLRIEGDRRKEEFGNADARMRMESGFLTNDRELDVAGLNGLARNQGYAINAAASRRPASLVEAEAVLARPELLQAFGALAQARYDPRLQGALVLQELKEAQKAVESAKFLGPEAQQAAQRRLEAAQAAADALRNGGAPAARPDGSGVLPTGQGTPLPPGAAKARLLSSEPVTRSR